MRALKNGGRHDKKIRGDPHAPRCGNSSPEMYSSEQRRSGAELIILWSSSIYPSWAGGRGDRSHRGDRFRPSQTRRKMREILDLPNEVGKRKSQKPQTWGHRGGTLDPPQAPAGGPYPTLGPLTSTGVRTLSFKRVEINTQKTGQNRRRSSRPCALLRP